ncbi:MAG: DUF2871 domain-containing protein [Clostridiales bacterium]|nr:DUF2871 domain-containing protein [Clostridiales bacterium]
MKRFFNLAFLYFILAMVGGVFYREFTKFFGFSGRTTLAFVHVHLLVLGTFLFLLLALFSMNTNLLEQKGLRTFLILYQIALPLMVIMMVIRGILQVLEFPLSKGMNSAISGIAGISHILMAISFVVLFCILKKCEIKAVLRQ